MNPNSAPTLYTPHVPSFLKVANHVPEFVPRTEANSEPCDYELNFLFGVRLILIITLVSLFSKVGKKSY